MIYKNNNRLSFLSLFFLVSSVVFAVPAKRGQWRTITLENGETVRVEARGDESARYWLSEDGRRFMLDESTESFSEVSVDSISARRAARRQLQSAATKRRTASTRATATSLPGSAGSYLGEKKGLVILVEFTNATFSMDDPQAFYERVCNEEGFSEENFQGSVADYFKAQSNGLFELTFDVVGPVTMSQPYSYYGRNDEANAPVMVHDACEAVDDLVDFSDYDWDDDGEAEEVFVLYAGYGEADNTDQPSLIWPHMYVLSSIPSYARNPLTLDGTVIETYACANELNYDDTVNGIGTFCHEFSHCLGLPDLYDTVEGTAFGMSSWSLMDYGNYNGNGYLPCGYTGYERMCVGWMDPIELSGDTVITDLTAVSDGGQAYLLRHPDNDNELLVLENRQQTGFDGDIPGHGMLVTHIDYDEEVWNDNEVNGDGDHQRWTIFHADNTDGFYDQEGDAYPYNGNDSLTAYSTPALTFYNALSSGSKNVPYALTEIAEDGDGVVSFALNAVDVSTITASVSADGVLFHETFDECSGTGGNDGRFSGNVARGKFNPDMDGWSYTSSAYGADQCARFGTSTNTNANIVYTPSITLTGDTATLTFRAAGWNSSSDGTSLSVTINGGSATFTDTGSSSVYLSMERGAWTDYTLTLTGTGTITLAFFPSRRFFLDEVLVTVPVSTTGITTVEAAPALGMQRVYTIDGRYVGDTLDGLPHGIYIVGGKKVVR